jgi:hypothetical protein
VQRVPDDLVLPPEQALAEAQRLLDEGHPFHAHEILEGVWKTAPDGERDLWQGLAQLAVGLTHLLRGNPVGATAVLNRGGDRIAPFAADPPYAIDVTGLLEWARRAQAIASGRSASGGDAAAIEVPCLVARHHPPTPERRR